MNIVIFNGSPREGNTKFAVETMKEGIDGNIKNAETHLINLGDKNVHGCIGCNNCLDDGVCIYDDDMKQIIEKVREADVMIFGSPVYWWGITSQLKAVIDRLYALNGSPGKTKKQIGLLVIGQDSLDGPQYSIISKQFQCICEFLEWDFIFDKAISADGPQDVKNDEKESKSVKELWQKINI